MVSCGAFYSFLFEYDTPRIVLIRSRKVGLVNRLVQLAILAYVIGWVFLWEKGYQETDSVVSSITTKVKGVTLTNTSSLGARIWDVADYVIPPQGENAVFVMTNVILTLNQTQGRCPEAFRLGSVYHITAASRPVRSLHGALWRMTLIYPNQRSYKKLRTLPF